MVPQPTNEGAAPERRVLKIAFLGSHGVGKTTLCFELAARLKRRDLRVDIVKEVARACRLPLNQDTTVEAQSWIIHTQIAQEIETTIDHDVIVCDRSILDNYAYMVHKFGRIQLFDGIMRSWIPTYDFLIKVPIIAPPSYDGLRDTRGDYQQEIDRLIESLIRDFRVECVRLPTWSRDNWIEQVIESLSLGAEQLGLFDEDPSGAGGAR
jgi:GTPase SAR1 family protein